MPKMVTFNYLEWRTCRYVALFHRVRCFASNLFSDGISFWFAVFLSGEQQSEK